jgi:hypothetical protein
MREVVERARMDLKNFLWTGGKRHCKTINPWRAIQDESALEEEEDRKVWEADPVHPDTLRLRWLCESSRQTWLEEVRRGR